jgi:branched-chain amino acid aminotransferase
MPVCHWSKASGWAAPEVRPYVPLLVFLNSSVLQYYTACFGGTKAYQGDDGKLRLFQIDFNYKFMLNSSFDTSALDKLLGDLVALEAAQWLPRDRKGETLYLRPTHTGTIASLGVQKPSYSKVYAVCDACLTFKA